VVGKWGPFRKDNAIVLIYHPPTQCACADFGDFAKQRNGDDDHEKHL
jgi:hypothetical protein